MIKLSSNEKNVLFENIIENNWNAITFANMQGIVEFVNSASANLYGYEANELIGMNVDVFNSQLSHNTEEIIESIINTGHWYGELIQKRKDGSTFDALLHVQIINDSAGNPIGYASNSKDITSDKESAKKLKQTILEKEMLIKEIHHRVKNNLSTVQGMLRLQQNSLKKDNLNEFLIDFQTRLSVLSEAHNNVITSSTLREINLGKYIENIVHNVSKLYALPGNNIDVHLELEPAIVSIDVAIPCGLIVNEAVTNSFKHGLADSGQLVVGLMQKEKGVELTVVDDGGGFDLNNQMRSGSLGLSLIDGLVSQIDGEYAYDNQDGCLFRMNFKID